MKAACGVVGEAARPHGLHLHMLAPGSSEVWQTRPPLCCQCQGTNMDNQGVAPTANIGVAGT